LTPVYEDQSLTSGGPLIRLSEPPAVHQAIVARQHQGILKIKLGAISRCVALEFILAHVT